MDAETIVERDDPNTEGTDGETLSPGTHLGRYVVLEEIGAGGMGLVYSAYDPELNRKVALKLLRPRHRERKRNRFRLLQEAQALAKLAHPNVITVYDVGTYGERVFVAMELVEGDTLRGWIDAQQRSWEEVLRVFIPAGRGLSAAHAANLVHRDFKPDNVLIGRDGRVRVMDFGLARPVRTDTITSSLEAIPPVAAVDVVEAVDAADMKDVEDPMLTQTGSIMGTPAFMAPEQHLGKATDHRSDQYSFCIALHQALYGERPFDGKDAGALARQKTKGQMKEPPADVSVPPWVRRIVTRGLSPDPDHRFSSMDELLDALADDPRVRRRKIAKVAAMVVVMVGAAFGVQTMRSRQPKVCQDSPETFAAAWNETRKGASSSRVLAHDRAHIEPTWTRAAAALDDFGQAWVGMHREACEATHLRGEQSTRLLELRHGCLQERLDEIDALADLFAEADVQTATRSFSAVLAIAPLSHCADAEALAAAVDPPADESTKAAVSELRRDLARTKALESLGKHADALVMAQRAHARALELDYPPVVAEALYRLGHVQSRYGDLEAAEANLSEANWKGAGEKHDSIAAAAAAALVGLVGRSMHRHEDGLGWGRHAEATMKRIGMSGMIEARLRHDLGVIHGRAGDLQRASEMLEQAHALYEKLPFAELARIELMRDVADLRMREGKHDEAASLFERARRETEDLLGPAHPEVAWTIAALGRLADQRSDLATAIARFEEAIELVTKALGPTAIQLVPLHEELSAIYARQRAWHDAIRHAQMGHDLLAQSLGDHPRVAKALHALGHLMVEAGLLEDARQRHELALSMWENTRGHDHPELAFALTSLGLLDLEADEPTLAIERLERALELRGGRGLDPQLLAHTQFALAKALQAAGGDPPRARELATKAHETLQRGKSPDVDAAAKIEQWLEQLQSSDDTQTAVSSRTGG